MARQCAPPAPDRQAVGRRGALKHLALVSAILFAAVLALGAELAPGWSRGETDVLTHAHSGYSFPSDVRGLRRLEPHSYDAGGRNVSVGYRGPDSAVHITTYIYPLDFGGVPDPEQHFKTAVQAALRLGSPARVAKAGSMDLPLGESTVPGYNALILSREDGRELGSFLVLIPREQQFLKIRATFDRDSPGGPMRQAWEATQALLRALPPAP